MTKSNQRINSNQSERPVLFPIIDRQRFQSTPKSRKPKDLERMLSSKASEDWVTWTAFRLLQRYAPAKWWPHLVELARAENPQLKLPSNWEEVPKVRHWRSVSSPCAYEIASRDRMQKSDNELWRARSRDRRSVEGPSEVDLILENSALVIFSEAKLGSDISARTKYDPTRNQIVRNIDCVLDRAGGREPMFWMVVRDDRPARAYSQLLRHYRAHPNVLVGELPHHDVKVVTELARNLTLLLWKDVVAQIPEASDCHDKQIASIRGELLERCRMRRSDIGRGAQRAHRHVANIVTTICDRELQSQLLDDTGIAPKSPAEDKQVEEKKSPIHIPPSGYVRPPHEQ